MKNKITLNIEVTPATQFQLEHSTSIMESFLKATKAHLEHTNGKNKVKGEVLVDLQKPEPPSRPEGLRIPPPKESLDTVNRVIQAIRKAELTAKEAAIFSMRHFSGLTLEEVGSSFNVTRERIRQIEGRAIERIAVALHEIDHA